MEARQKECSGWYRGTFQLIDRPLLSRTCNRKYYVNTWKGYGSYTTYREKQNCLRERERERDVISLTPVSWQSSAIFCWGRISTMECWTWLRCMNVIIKHKEVQSILPWEKSNNILHEACTWLLTTGISFSRIICSLSVSKFVKATVLILPANQ